jgi:hypothetical protein
MLSMKTISFLLLFDFLLLSCFGQLQNTQSWKGYENQKIDTIIGDFNVKGQYVNSIQTGVWNCYKNGQLNQSAYFDNRGKFTQIINFFSDGVVKGYFHHDNSSMVFNFSSTEKKFELRIGYPDDDNGGKLKVQEAWSSSNFSIISDTTFGLKKISDSSFIDRNNKIYSIDYCKFSISAHELIDERISINEDNNYSIRREKYKLFFNTKMTFDNTSKLSSVSFYDPLFRFADPIKNIFNLKSVRKDEISINSASKDNTYLYEVTIDEKKVMKGYFNAEGLPNGQWDLYHFQYFDTDDRKLAGAFTDSKAFRFDKLLQGKAPIVTANYINLPELSTQNVSKISSLIEDISYNDYFDKSFVGIDGPYEFTNFATYVTSGNEISLEDRLGYHLFQQLYYRNGALTKGFLFSPNGKIYDSINSSKDEYGETLTKNNFFKPFPEHAKSQEFQKQLVEGVRQYLNAAQNELQKRSKEEWKTTSCKQCSKLVDPETVVIVDGITCNNTGYPGGGFFCSNKCRYEYEIGYCRDKH